VKTISKGQRITFLADWWPRICELQGWDAKDRDFRLATVGTWIGRPIKSLSQVGRLKEFDALKSECMAILKPDDIAEQMQIQEQNRKRLKHSITHLAYEICGNFARSKAYLARILSDRFGGRSIDSLDESELNQLRNTLNARKYSKRRRSVEPIPSNEDPF